ncbi:hypothetical protein ACFYXL_14330 [Streptomyces tsukubensis]|uniref:hypothetical protein n=1 Tax=Streptomyces tsukubensis TaxID=83656 RepID=UPI0036CFB159
MVLEPTATDEAESLATALHAYLSESGFSFTGLTGKETTQTITLAVAGWAKAAGWRSRAETPMRYIDPPRPISWGCRVHWSPPWSAYLDLRLLRKGGPPIAVEIDREDDSTAVEKLRDEALRGRPAVWLRWHGALRTEVPAGVARLHLPTRSTKSPTRYSLARVPDEGAIVFGGPVSPEARADAERRDKQRVEEEERVAALPRQPGPIRCY